MRTREPTWRSTGCGSLTLATVTMPGRPFGPVARFLVVPVAPRAIVLFSPCSFKHQLSVSWVKGSTYQPGSTPPRNSEARPCHAFSFRPWHHWAAHVGSEFTAVMADAQPALFRELASFSGGAFQHAEERTQACASGDIPKLFDLP